MITKTKSLEKLIDKIKKTDKEGEFTFVSYKGYMFLVQLLGSKCEFVEIKGRSNGKFALCGVRINNNCIVIPDHRIH